MHYAQTNQLAENNLICSLIAIHLHSEIALAASLIAACQYICGDDDIDRNRITFAGLAVLHQFRLFNFGAEYLAPLVRRY